MLVVGMGLLLMTFVSGALQAMGDTSLELLGHSWSLDRLSIVLLYLMGFAGEVLVLTSIYLVMPVGRISFRHALIGGVTAAVLWEITRHLLVWYFSTLSQVSTVYGSLTTSIAVLLSLEIAATLLLFGAQVIAEYERLARGPLEAPVKPLRTD
jgi:YihY family inner membrane protein